jgi:hypothetical protein
MIARFLSKFVQCWGTKSVVETKIHLMSMPQNKVPLTQHLPAEAAAQAGSWTSLCTQELYTRDA